MLVLQAKTADDKVIITGLREEARAVPEGVRNGLNRIGVGIFDEAFSLLDGPGRPQVRLRDKTDSGGRTRRKTRNRGQFAQVGARPGSYPPVPSISGNLKWLLGWVGPGESKAALRPLRGKSGTSTTFTAGDLELVLFNSAAYASTIFKGEGTSSEHGERDAIGDAMIYFDRGGKIVKTLDEEIQNEINLISRYENGL